MIPLYIKGYYCIYKGILAGMEGILAVFRRILAAGTDLCKKTARILWDTPFLGEFPQEYQESPFFLKPFREEIF